MKLFLFCAAVLSLLWTSCEEPAKKSENNFSGFAEEIDSLRKVYNIPGLSMAIAVNDSVTLRKGYGYANLEDSIMMTAATPLCIASLTKPVFATVLMKLVEENKVDLNGRIKEYYPDYLGSCERILGYFNSEMPEYAFLLNQYEPTRDDILLRHHLSHTAETTPGTTYKYNGFLYGMLSDALQSATQISFDTWIDSLVIRKLQMQNAASSQLDETHQSVIDRLALPYHFGPQHTYTKGEFPDPELNAGSGLIFSADDLLLFDRAFNNNELIVQESKAQMLQPVLLNNGSVSPYGYGWFIQKFRGHTLVWHYGLEPSGYSGLYLKILEKNATLVLLANSADLSVPFALEKGDVTSSAFAMAFLNTVLPE